MTGGAHYCAYIVMLSEAETSFAVIALANVYRKILQNVLRIVAVQAQKDSSARCACSE